MSKRTTKLLTLELDLETLAEFSAAAEVFGARSKATFLNQYVVQKIREAKQTVSNDEFAAVYAKHLEAIQQRSERKSKERKMSVASTNQAKKTESNLPEPVPLEEIIVAKRNKNKTQPKKGKIAAPAGISEPDNLPRSITVKEIKERKMREPSAKD